MTRKPSFWKCILGVTVLSVLFIATWAATSAPSTTAKWASPATSVTTKTAVALRTLQPLPAPSPDPISSVFEVDGDIFDVPPGGAADDWSAVNCNGGLAEVKTFLHDGLGTTIFTQGGSKDPSDISVPNSKGVLQPGWKHTSGSVPDKDEILNAYAALYTGESGNKIVAFGADRYSNQGDSFFGAWFFQKNVYAASDGSFREQVGLAPDESTDPLAVHVIGDLLVLINFTGGGGVATGQVLEWVPVGTPCPAGATPIGQPASKTLCDITLTAPFGSVLGVSNDMTGAQDIPDDCLPQLGQTESWNSLYTPKAGTPGIIPQAHFFEGAINLDAFPALTGSCFNSFMIETRSSSSESAQLKDFVLGEFDTCPNITLTKTADDTVVCEGSPTTYTYTVDNPTALNLTITLVDDNETPADPTDDLDVLNDCALYNTDGMGTLTTEVVGPGETSYMCTRTLAAGEHTNIAKVVASIAGSSAEATATETVNVYANPTANAGTPQTVCEGAGFGTHDFVLSGTATNGTPSWSIVGANSANCGINSGGDTLTPTVTCTAFGNATARLTVISDAPEGTDCPDATSDVLLTINANATAAAGDDQSVCVDDDFGSTNFELSGSVTSGTPSWAITGPNSAACSIAAGEETTLTPTVTCTSLGTATVELTAVSDNACTNAMNSLVLTVNPNPIANAGDAQIACEAGVTTPFTLAGSASHGTTLWTCESAPAICANVSITDETSPTSGVVFTGTGSVVLKLTTTSDTSPSCGTAMDTVTLTVDPNPTVTISGDEACTTDEVLGLTATVLPSDGTITYSWSGPGITSATDLATITVNLPGTYTVEVTRKATADSDPCPAMATIHVGLCPAGACTE